MNRRFAAGWLALSRAKRLAAILCFMSIAFALRTSADEGSVSAGASATDLELLKVSTRPDSQPAPASRPATAEDLVVSRVLVTDIEGMIDPGTKNHFLDTIEEAERGKFGLVVFRMDTPGGLLDSTRDVVKAFMTSKVPVAVLVAPSGARAASAGAFITMAAHVAAMAPGTNIGAAHPVTIGGGDGNEESDNAKHLAAKAEEDTAAFAEGIAEQRHRNKEWARKAVVKSVSIVSTKAKEIGVIDVIASDVGDLLESADGLILEINGQWRALRCKGAGISHHEMGLSAKIVHLMSNPNISYLLFMAGVLGIAMELYHPGVIFPGVLGAISLILAFISFQIVPVNVGGILLILVGAGMLVAEAFVPSFGALGIGGAAAVVIGGFMLVDDLDPNLFVDREYGVSPWAMWPMVVAVVGCILLIGIAVVRSRRRPSATGAPGMIGQTGRALTAVNAEGGRVQLGTEVWAAVSTAPLEPKTRVRVTAVDGMRLTVEAADASVPPRPTATA
ncbi:MAG: nodulation protein NfeD [Deltaproteobacteria bacterium]|nr:nodulation protein NfeD [Deltaproteobacteria bacterium]